MSKEKQCECCHEWWYDSDVKENLCPNCYDYFKQLKQQLDESFTEKDVEGLIEDRNKTIKFLQQQIEEKDKEIENFKDFVSCKGCVDVIKKSNENQTQLAIQELEKVKKQLRQNITITMPINEIQKFKDYLISVDDFIDNQIKKLKGE